MSERHDELLKELSALSEEEGFHLFCITLKERDDDQAELSQVTRASFMAMAAMFADAVEDDEMTRMAMRFAIEGDVCPDCDDGDCLGDCDPLCVDKECPAHPVNDEMEGRT